MLEVQAFLAEKLVVMCKQQPLYEESKTAIHQMPHISHCDNQFAKIKALARVPAMINVKPTTSIKKAKLTQSNTLTSNLVDNEELTTASNSSAKKVAWHTKTMSVANVSTYTETTLTSQMEEWAAKLQQ